MSQLLGMTDQAERLARTVADLAPVLDGLLARLPVPPRDHVEFEDGFGRPAEFGTEYVHYFANYRILLSQDDLSDIAAKLDRLRADGRIADHLAAFDYLVTMLDARVRRLVEGTPFSVVSLGGDCLSRSVPTKWGIKPPRMLGELTMPFDLSVHPPAAVAAILESDFRDYLQTERLSFDPSVDLCVDRGRGILWNHEVGSDWAEDGFRALKETYARRIANFRGALTDGRPTVLVLYFSAAFDDAAVRLVNRIARAVNRLATNRIAIACIWSSDRFEIDRLARPTHVAWVEQTAVMFFSVPLPFWWYEWPKHEHFTRPEGMVFEQTIVDCVLHAGRTMV
jgi:hypothetical protein